MFKKIFVVSVFLALAASHTVFSQAVTIDTALANAAREISTNVPAGTRIAVLNITSDSASLSDYVINELIVNLVNAGKFQIVPRSTIELRLAQGEFDFQMSGYVSDDNQKRLGQFLEAGTIISGTITRDSTNSYRLVVNAIDLESFTYQFSFRGSFRDDPQVKTLIAGSGGVFYQDYTVGQRLGMGALNIFGGAGSIMNGHKIGWVTTGIEAAGVLIILYEVIFGYNPKKPDKNDGAYYTGGGTIYLADSYNRDKASYDRQMKDRNAFFITGSAVIGAGVVFGLIIPFFHHKPDNTSFSQNNFPFQFELASSNNRDINGLRISFNMRF